MDNASKTALDDLVEQAIADAQDDDEQLVALYVKITENLTLPFTTAILGVEASVTAIDLTVSGLVAICVRGEHQQSIPVLDLPLPEPPPAGAEWIAAFRHWTGDE